MEIERAIHGDTYVINKTCEHDENFFYGFLVLNGNSVLKEVKCAQCGASFEFKKKKIFQRNFRSAEFIIVKQCECETDELIYQFHSLAPDPFLIRVLCYQCKKECKFERKTPF